MKNFAIGLVLGILLSGMGAYLALPKIKNQAHDEAFAAGKEEGAKVGNAAAIDSAVAKAVAEVEATAKKTADSMKEELSKAHSPKVVKKVIEEKPKIQNWRVLGGQIAEPITEENASPATPATNE